MRAEIGDDPGLHVPQVVLRRRVPPDWEGWGMVCTSESKASSRIRGGFVLVTVASLMSVWRACRDRPLGIGDFRSWLACHELEARRCVAGADRTPNYRYTELARLLDVTEKRARASINRLVVAGLLTWSDSAIGFPEPSVVQGPHIDLDGRESPIKDSIGGGKGSVAIPRPMLRFLAAGARPALIATVLALLLRCLSRRRSGWDGRGRVKASWIARGFGVSVPAVKVARRELVGLGWIEPEESSQWSMNRFGRVFLIDLGWTGPASGPRSIPPRPEFGSTSIPPDLHQEPLPERISNQEPADGGTGFSISSPRGEDRSSVQTKPVPAGIKPVSERAAPLPPPRLQDVRLDDLKDTGRLLDLHGQAVAKGRIGSSEADRLRFVGAAEHALAIAQNAPALFAWVVLNGCWRYITQDDEDRANVRIKAYLRDSEPSPITARPRVMIGVTPLSSSGPIEPGLTGDAKIVREVRAAMIRAGIFRDPWPAFEARNPGWTRERWDQALSELGLR